MKIGATAPILDGLMIDREAERFAISQRELGLPALPQFEPKESE